MTIKLLTLTGLFIAATVAAQTPAVPASVAAGARLIWDQRAATLADAQTYTYRLYRDNVQVGPLAGVTCTAPVAASPIGTYPCGAPWAADIPGVAHSIVITTATAAGLLESAPSNTYSYMFTVTPLAPLNVRSGK